MTDEQTHAHANQAQVQLLREVLATGAPANLLNSPARRLYPVSQMQPQEFAAKWRELAPKLSERAAYQEHWRDLCALLGEPTPSSDLTGEAYAFEGSGNLISSRPDLTSGGLNFRPPHQQCAARPGEPSTDSIFDCERG